ncbi:HEAT repeat domain-containing protein [Candidatus Poribacteria bacterium]|jgi:HEAT repeat protein|nr:HEAT repeat domain-containing protein [Candidatus Poribacteria bacterium]MBT5533240.1 HEAT repeat domain-containing protein [Candidatus Poribacteria bacterium]MBT7806441.1 HEAT repeat domain-containing protein [Candidatus Poribacteria bacterium]
MTEHASRTLRAQRYWVGAFLAVLTTLLGACGTSDDTTINEIRKRLANGGAATGVESLLNEGSWYSRELASSIATAVRMPDSAWPTGFRSVLGELVKADASIRGLEEQARTEDLDDRSLRRMRALNDARDLAAEGIIEWLSRQDPTKLASEIDAVVDAALLAHKSPDPATRAHVADIVEALGADAYDALVAALSHEGPAMRAAAVRHLGHLGDERALAPLRGLIGTEESFTALYELPMALAHLSSPETVDTLMSMLALREDGSYVVGSGQARAEAIDQLAHKLAAHPDRVGDAIPVLLERLGDDNGYVVTRTQAALVSLGSAPVNATLALADGGWMTARLSVIPTVDADREEARRTAVFGHAVNTLVALREPTVMSDAQRREALRIFDAALADEDLRGGAAAGLRGMGGYALPLLVDRLDSDDVRIRVTAAQALGAINNLNAATPLIRRIENEREAEALAAMIAAIEAMRARDAIPIIVDIMESPRSADSRVQGAVISAIGRIGNLTLYPDEMERAIAVIRSKVDREQALSNGVREAVRNQALTALGKIKPDGVTEDLRKVLLDEKEPDTLRKTAAWALGERAAKSVDAAPALAEILTVRREEQRDFLRRLKKLYGNEEGLNERWQSLGWEAGYRNFREVKVIPSLVRTEVVHAYRKIKGADAAPLLMEVLEDDQRAAVRQAAARALKELAKGREAVLKSMREDEVGAVRAASAFALVTIKGEESVPHLLRTIREDDYETARVEAASTLRDIRTEPTLRGLAEVLRGTHLDADEELSPSLFARVSASLVLVATDRVKLDGPSAADPIAAGFTHLDPKVRAQALYVVGVVAGTDAVDDAIDLMRTDDSPRVRQFAAEALGRLKQRSAVPALLEVAADTSEWSRVRNAALWALSGIRATEAMDAFTQALESDYPVIRATGATALATMRVKSAEPAITRLVKDRRQPDAVRTAAIAALGALKTDGARSTLVELLAREVGALRTAVIVACGVADADAAVAHLSHVVGDRGETDAVRGAAATALAAIDLEPGGEALTAVLMDPTELTVGKIGADEHYVYWETASRAAKAFEPAPELLPYLDALVNDVWHSIHVRRQVPHAMGAVRSQETVPTLLRVLEHGDLHVRRFAIQSMGLTHDHTLSAVLVDLLQNARSVEERRDVPIALGELGAKDAVAGLTESLTTDADETVRRHAATALVKLGAYDAVLAKLTDEGELLSVRLAALTALEDAGVKAVAVASTVESLMDHEHGHIAFHARAAHAALMGTELGGV